MKRKFLTVLAAVLLVSCACAAGVSAAEPVPELTVRVNGMTVRFPDGAPYADANGRTMVPVRFVAEELGAEVAWDAAARTAVIRKDGVRVDVPEGSPELTVTQDGTPRTVTMDTEAVLKDGRTYVPVRFVAEALGAFVDYSDTCRTVGIWSDVLAPAQITALRAFAYTVPENAADYGSAGAFLDAGGLAYYYGTDRGSFGNYANAKEHLYRCGRYSGAYRFPCTGRTAEDPGPDRFLKMVTEEAAACLARESGRVSVRFLTDASCLYQCGDMDRLTASVRGLAEVELFADAAELTADELSLLCSLGIMQIRPGDVLTIPADVHMNTRAGSAVTVSGIVPLN